MKTILVPTDFSKDADNACRFAIEIAKKTKAKIILMHAFETPVLYSEMPMVSAELSYGALHDNALSKLKKYHDKIRPVSNGIKIELILQQGLASARISEIAVEKKADLIVVGTTGKSAVERVVMGSNTRRVIHTAPCMVLAIPPKAKYTGFDKIIYATDLTDDNLKHTAALLPFAKTFNSEILFLKIDNVLLGGNEDEEIRKITVRIKKFVKYPRMSGYMCLDTNVAKGINYFLKNKKADCLAMYTHHRNAFQAIFNTSITDKVAVHNSIPLLVIHESDYRERFEG